MNAQHEYKKDPEIKDLMDQLKSMFFGEDQANSMPDPEDIVVPEGMSVDIFLEKFEKHVQVVDEAFRDAVKEAKEATPSGEERVTYLQMLMMQRIEDVNAKATEAVGLTDEVFQVSAVDYISLSSFESQ